jgi:hypothetical protein
MRGAGLVALGKHYRYRFEFEPYKSVKSTTPSSSKTSLVTASPPLWILQDDHCVLVSLSQSYFAVAVMLLNELRRPRAVTDDGDSAIVAIVKVRHPRAGF